MKYQQAKALLDRLCDLAILFHASSELRTKMFEALDEHIPHLDQGCFERGCPMDDEPQPHKLSRDLRAAMAQQAEPKGGGRLPPPLQVEPVEPDLSRCPQCNGPADNGHDRSIPPNPYLCTKCMAEMPQPTYNVTVVDDAHPNGIPLEQWVRSGNPPQRKPLPLKTVEKLIYENTKINPNVADDRELLGYIVNAVRAVERAHGIKEGV